MDVIIFLHECFVTTTTNKTTPPINLGVWLIFIGSVYQVSA